MSMLARRRLTGVRLAVQVIGTTPTAALAPLRLRRSVTLASAGATRPSAAALPEAGAAPYLVVAYVDVGRSRPSIPEIRLVRSSELILVRRRTAGRRLW